jgi:pyrimidine operon attenuation protein/uracil phosphoribosyltransferase
MSKAKASATPVLREKIRIMSASEIERTLIRLAHQIIEKNNGVQNLGLVGIKRRGVPLAERLGALISGIEKSPVDTGVLDINFYRDDLSTRDVRPVVFSTPEEPYARLWMRFLTTGAPDAYNCWC